MTTTPTIWRGPFPANASNTAGAQFNPYTIGLSNGNFLVAWTDDTSGTAAGSDIFGQIYGPEGDAVGAAFQLNSFLVDGEFLGSIAPQRDGGFVIAYLDDEGAGVDAIRIERRSADGVATLVGSIPGAAGAISDPEITVAHNGSYMVTFTRDLGGGDLDVRAVVVSAADVVGAEFDAAQNSSDADLLSDTAGLDNNTFVTVYQEVDAAVVGIEARIVDSTGGFVANPQVASSGSEPHVTALTGDGFVVVWRDPANAGDIRFSLYNNTGSIVVADQVLVAGGANLQN